MGRIAVLLTTFNRPKLLAQSLPQIERETNDIGAQLVISDDQSSDTDTLSLLAEAKTRGVDVTGRTYERPVCENENEQNIFNHQMTGLNNLYGFKYCIENYDPELIIKVDDDAVLVEGAFRKLIEMWDRLTVEGVKFFNLSGIRTGYETISEAIGRLCGNARGV